MVTQIVYSQSVDTSRSKEINTRIAERNECIDLIFHKNIRITYYQKALFESDSLRKIENKEFNVCDSLYIQCRDSEFKLENALEKSKGNNKLLVGGLGAAIGIIIILLIL